MKGRAGGNRGPLTGRAFQRSRLAGRRQGVCPSAVTARVPVLPLLLLLMSSLDMTGMAAEVTSHGAKMAGRRLMRIIVAMPAALSGRSRPGGVRVPTPMDGHELLDVTGMILQVLLLLVHALRMEGDVILRHERWVLLREETLLGMDVVEAAQKSVPQHIIEGQRGGIGVRTRCRVRCSEVTVRCQLPEYRCGGTRLLALKLMPTLEQREVFELHKVAGQDSHKIVVGSSRRCLGVDDGADSLVSLPSA